MSARLSLLVWALLATVNCLGCSSLHCGDGCRQYGSPYAGMKYDCACETCGPNCGPGCDEMACGCAEEATCAVECGDQCGKSRRGCGRRGGCNGCGELYWCEWFNDPPAVCEPCDCHGNYAGPFEVGYYHAPYLNGAAYAGSGPSPLPPLEVAPPEPEPQPQSPPTTDGLIQPE
jgi:hypothetical protein